MTNLPICEWTSPSNSNQLLRELSESLLQTQYSSIYINICQKQCEEEVNLEVSKDLNKVLVQWKNCVDESIKTWK